MINYETTNSAFFMTDYLTTNFLQDNFFLFFVIEYETMLAVNDYMDRSQGHNNIRSEIKTYEIHALKSIRIVIDDNNDDNYIVKILI